MTVLATGRFAPVDWVLVAVIVLLLVVSAVLALAETSLVRTSRAKALALEDDGHHGARQLVRLVEHPERFLNALLLMVLACQLVVATLVGVLAADWFGGIGVAVAAVFEVVVIFLFGEALPKNWAVMNPERAALFSAPLVSAVVALWPLRMLSTGLVGLADLLLHRTQKAGGVSESEILALADVAMEESVIATEERAFIHSIIEFGDTVVREVMVPRPDMQTVDADQPVSEALGVALEVGYSRLPVRDGNVDDMVGVAYLKDLIRSEREGSGAKPVSQHMRPAHYVPETKRVSALMREMQDQKFHQAIVVDEYGGTAGLVTLEDLIEELVGEIVDEFDVEEPPVQKLVGGELSVSARLGVDELNNLLDANLPSGDGWDTVGGLVFNLLGHVPAEGETVEVDGFEFVAQQVQGSRIGRVRVVPCAPDTLTGAPEADSSAASR
jgi:CBS domain containing-hemolysin-like protein